MTESACGDDYVGRGYSSPSTLFPLSQKITSMLPTISPSPLQSLIHLDRFVPQVSVLLLTQSISFSTPYLSIPLRFSNYAFHSVPESEISLSCEPRPPLQAHPSSLFGTRNFNTISFSTQYLSMPHRSLNYASGSIRKVPRFLSPCEKPQQIQTLLHTHPSSLPPSITSLSCFQ